MKYQIGDRFVEKWYLGIICDIIEIVATTSHGKYVIASTKMARGFASDKVVDEAYLDKLGKFEEEE